MGKIIERYKPSIWLLFLTQSLVHMSLKSLIYFITNILDLFVNFFHSFHMVWILSSMIGSYVYAVRVERKYPQKIQSHIASLALGSTLLMVFFSLAYILLLYLFDPSLKNKPIHPVLIIQSIVTIGFYFLTKQWLKNGVEAVQKRMIIFFANDR